MSSPRIWRVGQQRKSSCLLKKLLCIKNKICMSLLLISICLMFAGCEQASLDDIIDEPFSVESHEEISAGRIYGLSGLPELWYDSAILCKRWAALFIVGSILLGLLLMDVFRTNKEIKKFALTILVIKLPIIFLLVVYLYTFLYGVFN